MRFGLFTAICFSFLVAAPAITDEKPADAPKPNPATQSVDLLGTAYNLVDYGRKTKSPEALIAAAGMLRRVPPAVPLKFEAEEGKPTPVVPKELPSLREEAEKLLAEAKTMSNNDAHVVALADEVANRKVTRGALGGPQVVAKALPAGSADYFHVKFMPGLPVQIVLVSGNGVPVNMKLYMHANGQSLTIGEYEGLVGRAIFMAPMTKNPLRNPVKVSIHIHNYSDSQAVYKLITN